MNSMGWINDPAEIWSRNIRVLVPCNSYWDIRPQQWPSSLQLGRQRTPPLAHKKRKQEKRQDFVLTFLFTPPPKERKLHFVLTRGRYEFHPTSRKRKKRGNILYSFKECINTPPLPSKRKEGKTRFCTDLSNVWNTPCLPKERKQHFVLTKGILYWFKECMGPTPASQRKKERKTRRFSTDLRNAFTNSLRFFGLVRLRSVSW